MKNKKYIAYFICLIILILLFYYYRISIMEYFNNVYISFSRTLIEEDRYMLFLNGSIVTILISFCSIAFGTILGILLFLVSHSKIRMAKLIIHCLVNLIQGTPVTVLLLIFYYVIFGNVNVHPIIVSIITFSIYFAIYVSEIVRSGYLSINKSQILSAYALGFNKIQAYEYIILPQVLTYIIPVFKNESVSLIKLTSVAGYISIMDFTKASDIIRNRTYEAFFPLIFTAIVYYLICRLMSKTLDYIYTKVNRRKVIKI